MTTLIALRLLEFAEPLVCLFALILLYQRGLLRDFRFVAAYLGTRVLSFSILYPVMHFGGTRIEKHVAYAIYFYVYWGSYLVEALLGFAIIVSLYRLAMAPLRGLQKLGMLMFRWAGGISVAIAITMSFSPHVTQMNFLVKAVTQLQQTQSILTLCMLLFVCLAIRPMGLSYRSKIFGMCLGLGVLAASDLIGSAWLSMSGMDLTSTYEIANGCAILCTLLVWMVYFALPEPRRRMIILPTTSPFLRWNQISIALGDEPGYVAIGEITPDLFAPAEVEIMRRASLKMNKMNKMTEAYPN